MARLPGDTVPLLTRLWRTWLYPHRATLTVVLVLIALVGASTGLYPALIKAAFDAFDRKDAAAIAYGPLVVIVVTATRGFALYGQTVLTNRVVTRVEADMQAALYGHLIDSDLAQLGRESPAALTQRFTTDFAFIKEALTRISTVLLRDIAMLIGLVAALVWMDPVLTLVAAVAVPFVAGPIGRIGRKLRRVSTSTQEQMGATASLISESLQGARVAKTYAMEAYLKGRAAQALDEVRRLKMKAANARGRLDPLLEIGGGIAVAGVLVLVGQRVLAGEKTVGDFTGYVAALLLAAQPARALGNLNAILQEAAAALRRYFDVMDEAPGIREAPGARPLAVTAGAIRFTDVRFRYRPDAPALEGIDLAVPAGVGDGPGRALGVRQILAAEPRAASLRRDRRPRDHRRPGCPRSDPGLPARGRGGGLAGGRAVRRHRSRPTSASAGPGRPAPRSRPRRGRRRPTTSSPPCRRATTSGSARRAAGSRAASGSGWRWPAPS